MKAKKVMQVLIPEEFRQQYLWTASDTYQYIGNDVEALGSDGEGGKMSRAAWVEVVRDANYISSTAERAIHSPSCRLTKEFVTWLKTNEYAQQYDQDMNALVGKAIFGV